jgi:branched-chain amino acid transport system substrate-binding protein
MRKTLVLLLAGTALAILSAPVNAADLTIAVAGPITGSLATIGDQVKRGAEAAAVEINAAGGVNGRTVKVVIEDDQCDPKQAVAVANHIIGEQIHFVDGHICSGSSIPASSAYDENNVLMMSPASSNPTLTEKGLKTILRLYGRDDAQGAFIAPYVAEKFKGKKIAVMHDKSAYGQGIATVVRDKLDELGVKPVLFEGLNPGEKDYSAIVSKLRSAGVEVLYYGGYHPEAALILRQSADQGYKLQIVSDDGLATPEFWSIAGPAGEGTLFTFPTDPRRSAAAAKALAYFKTQNFEPEGFTLFSYAVIEAIAEGVKRAGTDDARKVAAALENGEPVNTLLGPIKFDAKGDIADPHFDINQWRDGKFAAIQP